MDPQQEIFIAIRKAITNLGYAVFDGELPPEDTAYPFVYLGYTQQVDSRTKTQINGTVFQQIDVWHDNPKRRGDVSAMMLAIKKACFVLTRTAHFMVGVSLNDQSIDADDSTGKTFMRGMLTLKIDFS